MIKRSIMMAVVASLGVAATGCVRNSAITGKPEVVTNEDDLRKMAAFELGCNETRLDVMDMKNDTAAVQGCEKKAVYKWNNGWTLSSRSDQPAAQ